MRGYLGPLGDDFPSIFPIAMGLMFFFSAVTVTYMDYTVKQDAVTLMRANLALSRAVRSQITFTEEHFFGERSGFAGVCDLLDKTKANYGVRAKMELRHQYNDGSAFRDIVYRFPSRKAAQCGDLEDEEGTPLPYERTSAVTMTYPIVVEEDGETVPRSLVITTWKA
ncbi:MAG: hypothetical protein JW834_04145 [Candidatus Diapherotrites archaeon]|nr:hypothetical protein [Candidatus Diapherotrites archaeon]